MSANGTPTYIRPKTLTALAQKKDRNHQDHRPHSQNRQQLVMANGRNRPNTQRHRIEGKPER
jgi:hypothetical protein